MTTAYYLHAEGLIMPDAVCPDSACTPRLVAVIPVEDREQVERLGKALYGSGFLAAPRLVDALREFANPTPPKPDEPLGLGAVVEDAEGKRWVRADEVTEDDFIVWHCTKNSGLDWRDWSAIDVVRVLSEGVLS